jgi:hypothetical protein
MGTALHEAIREALASAEYPMTVGELRHAVRSVGVFGEDTIRGHLEDMAAAGTVARHQPHEKTFWHLEPPPWAPVEAGGTA